MTKEQIRKCIEEKYRNAMRSYENAKKERDEIVSVNVGGSISCFTKMNNYLTLASAYFDCLKLFENGDEKDD